jgi:hypothetical protein
LWGRDRHWWYLASIRQCQASQKCCHNCCRCMFRVYSNIIFSLQPGSCS